MRAIVSGTSGILRTATSIGIETTAGPCGLRLVRRLRDEVRETRESARDERREARDEAQEGREGAREISRDERQSARETREDERRESLRD